MKIFILILVILGYLQADVVKKVVFDVTIGDIKGFKLKVLSGIIHQINYYEGNLEELQVAAVIHGNAYKFFIKDIQASNFYNEIALVKSQRELRKRIGAMSSLYNVEFIMCAAGMKNLKIDKANIYNFVKFIPNAAIGLIDKQNEGFAYIPIN